MTELVGPRRVELPYAEKCPAWMEAAARKIEASLINHDPDVQMIAYAVEGQAPGWFPESREVWRIVAGIIGTEFGRDAVMVADSKGKLSRFASAVWSVVGVIFALYWLARLVFLLGGWGK